MRTPKDISDLVASEFEDFRDSSLAERSKSLLREPTKKELVWEYGNDETHDAWLIADMGERDVWAVYCDGGHGALGFPWGIIFRNPGRIG